MQNTPKSRYVLHVPQGYYEANSLTALAWSVFKHRCWHLFQGHGWVD